MNLSRSAGCRENGRSDSKTDTLAHCLNVRQCVPLDVQGNLEAQPVLIFSEDDRTDLKCVFA